jgi:hypothetical protein
VEGNTAGPAILDAFKLATIVSLTDEMIFGTNAEAIVSQVLIENVGVSLDAALFTNDAAVSGVRPAGILHGITPLTASAATTPLEAMFEDVQALAYSLAPVAGGGSPVIVAAPAQAAALKLRTPGELWPVFASDAVPNKTVIGIVPSALATAIDIPRIEAGAESVVHMEDTAPADIGTPGTPAVIAAQVYSMYQKDSVALRFILPTAWALRSPNAVAWIQTTNW